MANSRLRFFLAPLAGAASLFLAGCVNYTALDNLADARPTGAAFDQALFKDYAFLARSFGDVGPASYTTFDQEGSMSLSDSDRAVAALANSFAAKAIALSHGEVVDPVPGRDAKSHTLRDRLVRALTIGRDSFPRDAARAQADYDCWVLNATVPSQERAAVQCQHSLDVTLSRLENEVHADTAVQAPAADAAAPAAPDAAQTPAPNKNSAPPPQSSAAPAPSAQQVAYTVYFDFNSWTLTAEDLRVIQKTIDAARDGGQPLITVVGHTDTSGPAQYNIRLSVRRAVVVRDVLIDLGARREAVETRGVGESDLAVPTADGVREPKNRRSVITLGV